MEYKISEPLYAPPSYGPSPIFEEEKEDAMVEEILDANDEQTTDRYLLCCIPGSIRSAKKELIASHISTMRKKNMEGSANATLSIKIIRRDKDISTFVQRNREHISAEFIKKVILKNYAEEIGLINIFLLHCANKFELTDVEMLMYTIMPYLQDAELKYLQGHPDSKNTHYKGYEIIHTILVGFGKRLSEKFMEEYMICLLKIPKMQTLVNQIVVEMTKAGRRFSDRVGRFIIAYATFHDNMPLIRNVAKNVAGNVRDKDQELHVISTV